MPVGDLLEWLDEHGGPGFTWYVKRLSGNDTLANGSHQAGPYIPREILFRVLPALNRQDVKNPDVWFDLYGIPMPIIGRCGRSGTTTTITTRRRSVAGTKRGSRTSGAALPPSSIPKAPAR